MGFLTPEFIVMCADKRICRNGNIHSEDFKKVYYLNNNVVFGLAGSVLGNYALLSEYLEDFNLYCDENFRVDFDKTANLSFQEVCDAITDKFGKFVEKYRDSQKRPDVSIMIGGFVDGEGIVKRLFSRGDKIGEDETRGEKGVLCHLIFGSEEQEYLLKEKLENINQVSINSLQKVFQEVIDVSSQTNETINSKMNAVFIEKPESPIVPLVKVEVSSIESGIYKGKTKMESQKLSRADGRDEFYV